MDRWFLKDGVVCFKSEDAEINGWSLAGLVACLNKRDKTIADLEAKITESERENRELHTAINLSIPNQIAMKDEIERLHTCVDNRIAELAKENEQLKQQLAEKEKEIEELKQSQNQTAIAELEKVKEWFISNSTHDCNNNALLIDYTCPAVVSLIDQQIKSLKGEK